MKLSIYNICENSGKNIILFNTSNGNCVVFESDKYSEYEQCSLFPEEFYLKGFYVNDDRDEFNELLEKSDDILNKKDFLKLRILTTTGCNAKCHYCYEKGLKTNYMSIETAIAIVNFIKSKYNYLTKYVEIEWFGGEPLLNTKVIDLISNELNKHGIKFFSSMVSNGILIDNEIIEKMNKLWNLKKFKLH